MLVFTVATVLMIPPTVIAGLFGMNVTVPLTDAWAYKEDDFIDREPTWLEKQFMPMFPFMLVISLGVLLSAILYCGMKKYNYV
jgi:hypothetical protein